MTQGAPMHGTVHVVDDDTSYRVALCRLLSAAGLEPVPYGSAGEYLATDDPRSPACVLLDLRMPGLTGLDLQGALAMRSRAHPVVFLTGYADIPTTVRAIKEGAVDFLTKPVETDTLLRSLALALQRDEQNAKQRACTDELAARYAALTHRERQVMSGVVAGRLNKQIAYALDTAERTIKTHRSRVMSKMNVRCVPELVHVADQLRVAGVQLQPIPDVLPKDALRPIAMGAQ
jgi:FixJ family two-component response regulator